VNRPIRARHLVAMAPLVFLLAACGGDSPDGAVPGEAEGPPPGPVQVNFEPIGEFIAEGSVTLRRSDDTVTADILADSHLGPGDYPIHIHEGTCEEGGRVVVALATMTGGEGGEGTSVTSFPVTELPLDGTYFVQMHRADGTPIACADFPALTNL
jgi:hypothetical protein